jgi:transcriptional regulator NrdR family protein
MGIKKQVNKQGFNRRRVIADLVIARRLRPAQFQSVERRLAGQRRTIRALRFEFADREMK